MHLVCGCWNGESLSDGPFHTPTVLSLIPPNLRMKAHTAGLLTGLAESKMALGGGEQGCKQVETVPVMVISILLGRAQLWMKKWGYRGQGGESWLLRGGLRGLKSLSKAQLTLYKNFLQNEAIPVSGGW